MAKPYRIRNAHEAYLGNNDAANPSWTAQRSAKHFDEPEVRRLVQAFKAQGVTVYVFGPSGQVEFAEAAEPNIPEPQSETFRGMTPIRLKRGLWRLTFSVGPNFYTLDGTSPHDIFNKVFDPDFQASSEALREFVKTLPPEEPAAPVVVATPASPTNPNGHIVRPGDADRSVLPERRVGDPTGTTHRFTFHGMGREQFLAWSGKLSSAQMKPYLADAAFQQACELWK